MSGNAHNEKGYFENAEAVQINDHILAYNGVDWKTVAQKRLAEPPDARDRIEAFIDRQSRDIYVKDPRFCLTLHIWRAYVPVDKVMTIIRDPGECVQSIYARDKNVVPLEQGYRLYDWYMMYLMENTRSLEEMVVDYGRFLESPLLVLSSALNFLGLDNAKLFNGVEFVANSAFPRCLYQTSTR